MTLQVQKDKKSRTLRDAVLLVISALLLITLMAGGFWVFEKLGITGIWRLYVAQAVGLFALAAWRVRRWFRHRLFGIVFCTWIVAHLLLSALIVHVGLPIVWIWWFVLYAVGAKVVKDYGVRTFNIPAD